MANEVKLCDGVELKPSTFDKSGGRLDYGSINGDNLIIVLGNNGFGYQPLKVLLPGQLYLKDITRFFTEQGYKEISIASLHSDEIKKVATIGRTK